MTLNLRLAQVCGVIGAAWLLPINVIAEETGVVTTVSCTSAAGERQECAADTSAGVVLARTLANEACLLGKNWGYTDDTIWVTDGCSAEFIVAGSDAIVAPAGSAADDSSAGEDSSADESAESTSTAVSPPEKAVADPSNETWGFFDPGRGFLLGKSNLGELSLSGYALVRYLNQVDRDGEFTDHLGNVRPVDGRKDIYSHRVLVWLNGWVGTPKLRYTIAWWTVTATDQDALFGNIGYQFSKKFNLYAGIFGNPGSRSMQGSHPYWLGNDRVMADEFFRPFFTQGIFANGELSPGIWYSASIGNSSSILGTTAAQLDRKFTYGGSLWWMPTTKEFGPRGAYGDWEMHDKVATRFGVSAVYSPEERYNGIDTAPGITAPAPGNTSLKLADSVNLFETGALVDGITVTNADYRIIALDAGMKYKGIFLQTEYYYRILDGFRANGALPVQDINDHGFYVQAAFYPVPKKIELYAATSQVFGDSSAGFRNSSDYIIGMNYYIANSRNNRLNIQLIDVNKSPVSSTFGYYVGGQTGYTVAVAASIFF